MNVCTKCQSKKHNHVAVETEDVFEICRKCGNAYYEMDFGATGFVAGFFDRIRSLFH